MVAANEVWKDIPFAPGYQVGRHGGVRSRNHGWRAHTRGVTADRWRVLNGGRHPYGYTQYQLRIGGRAVKWFLHRLVAYVFHGPPPFPKAEVRHLDGNPANNAAENLAWGTHKENQQDIPRHGRIGLGEDNIHSALANWQVREMVQLWAWGMTQRALATHYGVSPVTVGRVVRGLKWSSVTGLKPLHSTTDDPADDSSPPPVRG